jgi:hypothetical protein
MFRHQTHATDAAGIQTAAVDDAIEFPEFVADFSYKK